ncbi:MAG: methylenetetrahydrofolate reductase [Gammaproteobacteria bacterium]
MDNNIKVSFEFFPPKTPEAEASLWKSIERLAPLNPCFMSVTYGADGSTRDRTHDIVQKINRRTGQVAAPHLTCVGATRAEINEIAQGYWDDGIRHIVALRGDPPAGIEKYEPHPDGYDYAVDLVKGLKEVGEFEISVAAYPEVHPDAPDTDFDLENLKRKIDAGATRAITQFFFDANTFLRFRDKCAARGINAPIVPGILPITKLPQLLRFANMCGASVPDWLRKQFEGMDDDAQTRQLLAAAVAINQVHTLQRHGVTDFHFYTLNRSELSYAICCALGLRPQNGDGALPGAEA